jgi:hypothetical protein
MNRLRPLFLLLAIDLILLFLYWYYQPLCEPCLDKKNCPPCISKEQYFIIYFGVAINVVWGLYCLCRHKKTKE